MDLLLLKMDLLLLENFAMANLDQVQYKCLFKILHINYSLKNLKQSSKNWKKSAPIVEVILSS